MQERITYKQINRDKEIPTSTSFLITMTLMIIAPIIVIMLQKHYAIFPIVIVVLMCIAFPSGCIFLPIGLYLRYELQLSIKYHAFLAQKYNEKRAEKGQCALCNHESDNYAYMVVAYIDQRDKAITKYGTLPICSECSLKQ